MLMLSNGPYFQRAQSPFLGQHRTENCVQKMSLRGKIKT